MQPQTLQVTTQRMFRPEQRIVTDNAQEHSFASFVNTEDLIDKLNLLGYNTEFVKEMKMKPLNRHYFMIPKNPGEQFYVFTSLVSWLIRKSGESFPQPQEYDDPNSTIASILDKVRELGTSIDFPPNKLKQGVGEPVVFVLNCLADNALQKRHFKWEKPTPPQEQEQESDIVEDESELILDRIEEEMAIAYSDESDEEGVFHVDDLSLTKTKPNKKQELYKINDSTSNVDSESWRLELERVIPQLKIIIRSENRDWRAHFEEMKNHRKGIEESLTVTKVQLDKLYHDILSTLEKISSREKHLNRNLEPVLNQYRSLFAELSKLKENYKNISGGVTEKTRELAKFSDQLESIKHQMEERGTSMTDGTPLVNLKKAVSRIRAELTEMNVRIGVLESMLLQSRLRDKKLLEEDLGSPINVH